MRRILISIDGSPSNRDSLRGALALCEQTGASLTVVYPRHDARGAAILGEVMVMLDGAQHPQAQAPAVFEEICGRLPQARFLTYEATGADLLATLGHAYDLLLIERMSREAGPEADLLNAALFETGRPVLLLPPLPRATPILRPVLAWNGSPLSARAISSALPLLRPAARAVVLIGTGVGKLSPEPLLEYLASHGIAGEVRSYDSHRLTARGRGRALLAAAVASEADLLVAGAFGETAAGSIRGLGRATRKLATAAPMPVLLQN